MSEETPVTSPSHAEQQAISAAHFPLVPGKSGFSPFEIEHISKILVRIALRMQEIDENETVQKSSETTGRSIQSVDNTNNTTRRKSRHILQTIHAQPVEK